MKETAGQCWTVSRPTQKALEHGFNAVSFHTESMRCEIEIFSFFIFCGVRWFRQSNKERWCAGVLQQQRPWCCEVNHYNSTTNKLKATLCACCSNLSCWLPSPSLSFMSDHYLFICSALSDSDQLLSGWESVEPRQFDARFSNIRHLSSEPAQSASSRHSQPSHWNHLELLLLTVSRLPRSLPALSSPSKQKQIELSWRQMVGVVTSVCVLSLTLVLRVVDDAGHWSEARSYNVYTESIQRLLSIQLWRQCWDHV